MRPKKYLNNKDLLAEIHKSKNTFSSFTEASNADFDIILLDVNLINIRTTAEAKRNKAKRLGDAAYKAAKILDTKVKQAQFEIDYRTITKEEIIFRAMTFDHIPDEPGRKKNPKTIADTKVKLNFPPFQHFKFNDEGELTLVGKSHWDGDLNVGKFDKDKGQATNELAKMWIKLCDRYGTRGNVRGYTYNDEMRAQAILQLAHIGLQFDESKSLNPFAYYTTAVTNSFVRVINIEKRNQNIRDDILEMNDMSPSYTRQNQGLWEVERNRAEASIEKDSENKGLT